MNLAKPEKFVPEFSRNKYQKSYLKICDGGITVNRYNGNGSFPICLATSPLSPVSSKVCFRVDKAPGDKAVALGVCL